MDDESRMITQNYLHNFIVPSIEKIGLSNFRVTIHNKYVTKCKLYYARRDFNGKIFENFQPHCIIEPNKSHIFVAENTPANCNFIFSLVPEKYFDIDDNWNPKVPDAAIHDPRLRLAPQERLVDWANKTVEVTKKEIQRLIKQIRQGI